MTEQNERHSDWLAEVTETLREQKDVVAQLDALGDEQRTLVERGDTNALLTLLNRRQQLIDAFVEGQKIVKSDEVDLEKRLVELPQDQQQAVRDLIEEISTGLATVMERDAADQQQLEQRRDKVRDELGGAAAAKQAHRAYTGAKNTNVNRYSDRQG